jgi:hypothetical protein
MASLPWRSLRRDWLEEVEPELLAPEQFQAEVWHQPEQAEEAPEEQPEPALSLLLPATWQEALPELVEPIPLSLVQPEESLR